MAKLQIKRRKDAEDKLMPQWSDYDFLVDGYEPTFLTGLTIDFSTQTFPEVKLTFLAEDVDIDADTLASLRIMVEEQEKKQKEGD